jgi:hypothetical protein
MKKCCKCGVERPLDQFGKSRSMPDGLYPTCKPCRAEKYQENRKNPAFIAKKAARARVYYQQNHERIREQTGRYHREGKGKEINRRCSAAWEKKPAGKAWRQRYFAENPEKRAAYTAVQKALRNKRLLRAERCERCNKPARTHGHHTQGYSPEFQLVVEWLCPKCHRLADLKKAG